jgi:hypothetical protein
MYAVYVVNIKATWHYEMEERTTNINPTTEI